MSFNSLLPLGKLKRTAGTALTIAVWVPICIGLIIGMASLALRLLANTSLSTRRYKKYPMCWIEQFLKRLAGFRTSHDRIVFQSRLLGQRCNMILKTANRNNSGITAITGIYQSRNPSTVFWLVIPIIVDAIKLKTFRAITHICKEISEARLPLFADFNSASAVIMEFIGIRIHAPLFHCGPSAVERVLGGSGREAMLNHGSIMPVIRRHCNEF